MKNDRDRGYKKPLTGLEKVYRRIMYSCYFYRLQTYPKSFECYLEQAEWASGKVADLVHLIDNHFSYVCARW
jgi:hypothetical protein